MGSLRWDTGSPAYMHTVLQRKGPLLSIQSKTYKDTDFSGQQNLIFLFWRKGDVELNLII